MWMTPDGVAHTVALHDPADAMEEDFMASIESLSGDDRGLLSLRIADLEEDLFEVLTSVDEGRAMAPPEVGLPVGFLHGRFDTVDAIGEYLGRIELPWRLDAFTAVEDLLDSLAED